MRRLLLPLLLIAAACASTSGNRPADIAKPSIVIRQSGSFYFGSSPSAPISIDVTVTNNASVPLRVREIEVGSTGMMQYSVDRASKIFNETLQPGESRTMGLTSTARSRSARPSMEPLSVQAVVRFEANGRGFREIVTHQFAGPG
jgi:hypothetical protein